MSDAAVMRGKAAGSPGSPAFLPPSGDSASEQSWLERDSGLEPQAAAERVGEEMNLVLLSLMEHYRASLCLAPNDDVTTGAVGRSFASNALVFLLEILFKVRVYDVN